MKPTGMKVARCKKCKEYLAFKSVEDAQLGRYYCHTCKESRTLNDAIWEEKKLG
ncbi:MAG: hypothetical protein ACXABE_10645 [Candidatus Thorarchaeota archaeon]|jgi:formylmethanofuran dehydrogenase subunit E